MKQLLAYINFPGNTREVMNFYKDCLGGELEIMTFKGSPMEAHFPAEMHDQVMHSHLTIGDIGLMASDMPNPAGITPGNNMSLMLACSTEEEMRRIYDALSAGGDPDHPVQPAFWGGLFGHLTDKYGIAWLLTCETEAGA